MKRAVSRLGLILFGVVLALILLEGALRVLATFVGDLRGGARGRTTILCVGDSHTYGLHVLPSDAYPARLQGELDPTTTEVGVLNFGVPGRNSGALARELPRYLREAHPDLVLVKVGFNDSWNHDAVGDSDDGPTGSGDDSGLGGLRVLRLFRLLRLEHEGRTPTPPDLIERDGEMFVVEDGRTAPAAIGGEALGTVKGAALAKRVGASLRRIVAQVRNAGATPVFLTYATENQPVFLTLNENARRVAAELDVPLVALDAALREPIAEQGYRALFFPDDHPTARGNERVARVVADRLVELGLVRRSQRTARAAPAIPSRLELLVEDAAGFEFAVHGAPDRDFQIVLSPLEGPPFELGGLAVPLGAHPMVARSLESQNLRGRTDRDGRARCRLSRAFVSEHAGTPLHAIAAVFPPAIASAATPELSNVVSIRP